jgi:aryl-alcohol dehydrogenase-like predicted oxidoreductase
MMCGIAKRIGCTPAQLGIAWCLKNENVTSVIIGASTPAQAKENIQALNVRKLLTDDVMLDLDRVIMNIFVYCIHLTSFSCFIFFSY